MYVQYGTEKEGEKGCNMRACRLQLYDTKNPILDDGIRQQHFAFGLCRMLGNLEGGTVMNNYQVVHARVTTLRSTRGCQKSLPLGYYNRGFTYQILPIAFSITNPMTLRTLSPSLRHSLNRETID